MSVCIITVQTRVIGSPDEPVRSRGVRRRPLAGHVLLPLELLTQNFEHVPLGKSNSQTKFRSSLILDLATRGPNPETQKVL
jgi:hypothetical protein